MKQQTPRGGARRKKILAAFVGVSALATLIAGTRFASVATREEPDALAIAATSADDQADACPAGTTKQKARKDCVTHSAGGPFAKDFVDIKQVKPNVKKPATGRGGSTGTFSVECGVDAQGRHNSDNV